ncbi:MAG: hypothetical protein OQL08_02495 [Gammaproteobacteria bacterium]|nr:hypothetical protein [Gammaproteobacteria bacterium]
MTAPIITPQRPTSPIPHESTAARRPGRPAQPREQLPVPGQPRAAENRPVNAPGRIPVAAPSPVITTEPAAPLFDSDTIQREVESSTEYQTLKKSGYIKEQSSQTRPHRIEAETPPPEREQTSPANNMETVTIEFRQELRIDISTVQGAPAPEPTPKQSDPLALDLDGNGLQTSGLANGVQFDINADGRLDQTSFVSGGDAFLALDANANGRIDDGNELFGDQHGDANGYLALARHDDNHDGVIDGRDAVFQQLRLFTQSRDGGQQLRTLAQEGIVSLSLNYHHAHIALNHYDTVAQLASFQRSDGSHGESGDLLLGYRTLVP